MQNQDNSEVPLVYECAYIMYVSVKVSLETLNI